MESSLRVHATVAGRFLTSWFDDSHVKDESGHLPGLHGDFEIGLHVQPVQKIGFCARNISEHAGKLVLSSMFLAITGYLLLSNPFLNKVLQPSQDPRITLVKTILHISYYSPVLTLNQKIFYIRRLESIKSSRYFQGDLQFGFASHSKRDIPYSYSRINNLVTNFTASCAH